ncbi:MAG: hypothetical protein LH603_02880 [Pseudonocardia sp.]|nr:hypothetical protein [Pseudonocardia sp.]
MLLTEGLVTLVDALLAGSVLIGLVLNAALGWWWAAISFRIDAYSIWPSSWAVTPIEASRSGRPTSPMNSASPVRMP